MSLAVLSAGCSLRTLDDLESAQSHGSDCEPALQAQCARGGASCDVVESVVGELANLCRWQNANTEALCTSQALGIWMPAEAPFALDHPGTVPPGAPGACVIEQAGSAATTSVELCFQFEPAFSANGGDFPLPGENEPARGVRFRVTDAAGVEREHDADPLTGCQAIELDSSGRYAVSVLSRVRLLDGNEILLLPDDLGSATYNWNATTNLVPSLLAEPRARYVWPANPPGNATANVSTVMAALVRTLAERALTTGETYRAYFSGGTCTIPCVQVDRAGAPALFFPRGRVDKFAISNMLAQLGTQLRLGGEIGSAGGDLPDCALADPTASRCANGATHVAGSAQFAMGTEEYGNCAFVHGWTHYVATSVWNRADEANCDYKQRNRFGDCYEPGSAAQYCYAGAESTLAGVGFERDWLTALWALERLDGCAIPFRTVADILESADPRAWTNSSARSALLEAAPRHLSGPALECFGSTLEARIIR